MPIIYDRDGNYYIVTDDGSVLNSAKARTEFTVKGMGDLFSGDEYIGNIYLNGAMGKSDGHGETTFGAPLKAPKRSYIMMIKSADGINWSKPCDISANIINDADGVTLTTGRGCGAVSESGRLFVPLTSEKGACCVYSLDEGNSWSRNQRMPYIPMKDDEVSLVGLESGELLALGKKWCISHDKGLTWLKEKAKAAPIAATVDGERLLLVMNSPKIGTYLLGGDIKTKGGKFKGIKLEKNTSALAGAYFPTVSPARVKSGLALLCVSYDNQEVALCIIEV